MTPQLPSFLRRRLKLSDARKALLAGEPELALDCLEDSCLVGSEEAEKLRERVLDVLCREAAKLEEEGDPERARELFLRVGVHDPSRARAWRRRLDGELAESRVGPTSGVRREAESGIIGALEKLLGEMRDERHSRSHKFSGTFSGDSRGLSRSQDSADQRPNRGAKVKPCFKLGVDDIGEFFAIFGSEVSIGHARAEVADLPIMADIDPEHVRLIRTESFHAGPGWRIEATAGQEIAVGGQLVDPGGAALIDGDEIRLAGNLSFVFRRPEAASGTAILELLHGAECAGTLRILLFAPGAEGRVRLSATRGRQLYARRLEEDVILWIDEEELVVECASDLRAEGGEVRIQESGEWGPGGLRTACPPPRRVSFTVGRGGPKGPPFGFAVGPLDPPTTGGAP